MLNIFFKKREQKVKQIIFFINDNVRDKMLGRESNVEDCDEENVSRFLCLLKGILATQSGNRNEVIEEEFTTVVKKSKRRSTSSMFSKRDYSVHNCATCCEQMVKVLARFYDVLI